VSSQTQFSTIQALPVWDPSGAWLAGYLFSTIYSVPESAKP